MQGCNGKSDGRSNSTHGYNHILPEGCVQFVTDPGLSQHLLWLRSRPSTGKLGKIGKILGEIGKINCFHKNAFQMNNEQNTKKTVLMSFG